MANNKLTISFDDNYDLTRYLNSYFSSFETPVNVGHGSEYFSPEKIKIKENKKGDVTLEMNASKSTAAIRVILKLMANSNYAHIWVTDINSGKGFRLYGPLLSLDQDLTSN